MKQCWRWFGPKDKIPLSQLHQVGVEGIVTALHHIAPGDVWDPASIRERIDLLAASGFTWDVVESLPVSETIKTKGPGYAANLDAYRASLTNLAQAGIHTVCYNFMPILDWTRTILRAPQPHGGTAMHFSLLDFAVFDLHILQRATAAEDYSPELLEDARARYSALSEQQRRSLQNNIIAGLPGANDTWTLSDVSTRLATYDGIDAARLRQNLIDFLSEVAPHAQDLGIRLCCHPDDPPFPLLGLPRVMSSTDDYASVLEAADIPASGATLCTGSLGVAPGFDPVGFVQRLGPRIHFVHLRNTKRVPGPDPKRPDFFEAPHLEGDTDMVGTICALMQEEANRRRMGRTDAEIPMRPDHGQELLSDLAADTMPGYPLIGRMRGLAELRGIMAACQG
ncbi:mannonate dehydratase [uncultured Roseobacter sp.]|uniref:mannonate dehydratase n=1 Tax=uncultured Roseobacter sp. TaxID=114847 RepID=UPI002623391B|nr:mannonate dehydratase [uncultured Roseobacter sp.]